MSFQRRQGVNRLGQTPHGALQRTAELRTETKAPSPPTTAKVGVSQHDDSRKAVSVLMEVSKRLKPCIPYCTVSLVNCRLRVTLTNGQVPVLNMYVPAKRPHLIRMARTRKHGERVLYVDTATEAAMLAYVWVKNYRSRA